MWDNADFDTRVMLMAEAYEAQVRLISIREVTEGRADEKDFKKYLWVHSGKPVAAFKGLVRHCDKYEINGIDYIQAQFAMWPQHAGVPLVPPFEKLTGNLSMQRYGRWVKMVMSERNKAEKADSRSIIDTLMRVNGKLYPDVKSVLRNPAIVQMLPTEYLQTLPEMKALVDEGYYPVTFLSA